MTPKALALLLTVLVPFGQRVHAQVMNDSVSVEVVMSQVAASQDRSEASWNQRRCVLHIHIVTTKPGARVMREETTDSEISPGETGTQVRLRLITGRYWHKGKYEDFKGEPVPAADTWDADYMRDVRMCLTGEKSRCTATPQLFPLTSEEQKKYDFRLIGREMLRGRDVYHIAFVPKTKNIFAWAGEAYINAADLQIARVFTNLSQRVPFAARTVLGTDISDFGYNVEYKSQQDGTWLPTSYGTEYELRLFFHINRTVSVSMDSSF